MTLTKSLSCVDLPTYQQAKPADKRVRWSIELEEVRYYKPTKNTTSTVLGKKLKNVRRKASIIAERAATGFANIPGELTCRILRTRSSSYEISDYQSDPNKAWDELFDLYGAL